MDSQRFFADVATRLRCDARRAEGLTLAVFRELRVRLTPKEAGDVAAQLPIGLKRLWEHEFDAPDRSIVRTHRAEFVGRVRKSAGLPDDAEAERAVRAVFGELQQVLGSPTGLEGEAWDVFSQLPKDLKQLWVAAAQAQER